MLKRRCASSRAFTLVELLVVIGIIAVLVSILLPALNRARAAAQLVQCASNLRQFAIADQVYQHSYRNWHMPAYWPGDGPLWNPRATNPIEDQNPYNRSWPGLPEFRKTLSMPIIDKIREPFIWCYVDRKWYCPTALRGLTFSLVDYLNIMVLPMHYSYGMNVQGIDMNTFPQSNALDAQRAPHADPMQGKSALHAYRRSKVKRPAEKLMFVDSQYIVVNIWGSGIHPGWMGAISDYDQTKEWTTVNAQMNTARTTVWRHNKGANVCFFDGHVSWLRRDQIFSLDNTGKRIGNVKLWHVME